MSTVQPATPPTDSDATSSRHARRGKGPSPRLKATDQTLSSDQRMMLESSCVDVICQLENQLERACTFRDARQHRDAYHTANRMLVTLLEFAEGNLDGDPLETVYADLATAYELTSDLSDAISAHGWSAMRRVVGKSSTSEMDILHIYDRVGRAVAKVTVSSLGYAIRRVDPKTTVGRQLHQSLASFIDQLQKVW